MELATKDSYFSQAKSFLRRRFETKGFYDKCMAVDEYGNLHDPFGGRKRFILKTIKHVSPAFVEDPLRVIRLGRFLAQLTEFKFIRIHMSYVKRL